MDQESEKEGWQGELRDGQNPSPKASPRSIYRQERRERKKCRRGAAFGSLMKKNECVRVIERKKGGRDDPMEYFPTRV